MGGKAHGWGGANYGLGNGCSGPAVSVLSYDISMFPPQGSPRVS